MERGNELYAEAMQQTRVAKEFAMNANFWKLVLDTLYEEDPNDYEKGELKKRERDIRKRLRNNLREADRFQKMAEKTYARFRKVYGDREVTEDGEA